MKLSEAEIWEDRYKKDEKSAVLGRLYSRKAADETNSWKEGEEILKLLKVSEKDTLLDAGCGSFGTVVIPAAKKGIKVTGVDISETTIKLLQKRIVRFELKNKCKLLKADITSLKFPSESFTKVACSGTALHIFNLNKMIEELGRVTKYGGLIYISSLKNDKAIANYFYRYFWLLQKFESNKINVYFHSFDEIKKIFHSNNLKIVKIFSYLGVFPFYMNFVFSKSFEQKYVWKKVDGFVPSAHTWAILLKKIDSIKTFS